MYSIASKYTREGVELQDQIQEGIYGILVAISRIDLDRLASFNTYVATWINSSIHKYTEYTAPNSPYSRTIKSDISDYDRCQRRLEQDFGRQPTQEEICAALHITLDRLSQTMRYQSTSCAVLSFDRFLYSQDGDLICARPNSTWDSEVEELVEDRSDPGVSSAIEHQQLVDRVHKMLESLEDDERLLISMFFGLDGGREYAYREIAEAVGITSEWVRRRTIAILKKLRADPANADLLTYLD